MSEITRLYKYRSLLSSKRVLTPGQLTASLEISRATLKRDLAKLREQFHLPVRFDRDRQGYLLENDNKTHELPGFWLGREEIATLYAIQQLASQIQPGMLSGKLDTLGGSLQALMQKNGFEPDAGSRKMHIVHARKRRISPQWLDAANHATVTHKRVRLIHVSRETGEVLTREVSPQRVILYRDNWYLAAWCHLRSALRIFSIDSVQDARVIDTESIDLDAEKVEEAIYSAYGVYLGKPKAWAVLRFTAKRARWVSSEDWHPRQVSRYLADGSFELKVPYSDDRELVGEILSFGSDVVVVEPRVLRSKIQKMLLEAAGRYVDIPQ